MLGCTSVCGICCCDACSLLRVVGTVVLVKACKLRVFTGKDQQTASHEWSSTSHAGMESANSVEGQTESSGPSNIHVLITYKIT